MAQLRYRGRGEVRTSRLAVAGFWMALVSMPVFSLPMGFTLVDRAGFRSPMVANLLFFFVLGSPLAALAVSIAAKVRLHATLRGNGLAVGGIVLSLIACAMLAGLVWLISGLPHC